MISTNEKFHFKLIILYFLPIFLFFSEKSNEVETKFLGYSCYERSYYMRISIFLGLVIVLFITLLRILRILRVKKILYV